MLDLKLFSDTFKLFPRGLCTKYTFNMGKEKYFFKTNYTSMDEVEVPAHIIEVLCSRILEKVGCSNFVQYEIGRYGKKIGCVCKSYKKDENETEINLIDIMEQNKFDADKLSCRLSPMDNGTAMILKNEFYREFKKGKKEKLHCFSIDDIVKQLETYCESKDLFFYRDKLIFQIEEMAICDYFFYNSDRNWENISLLIDQKGEVRLVPIYDNGMSFGLLTFPNEPKTILQLGLSDAGTLQNFKEHGILKENGLIVADILQISQNDSKIKQYVDNFLALDIEQMISDLEVEENIILDKEVSNRIIQLYNERQAHFNSVKEKIEKRVNKNIEKNL